MVGIEKQCSSSLVFGLGVRKYSLGFWGILSNGQTSTEKHSKKLCQVCGILVVRKKPQPQTSQYVQVRVTTWANLRGC